LFGWGSIIASVGWREGLLIGAGAGLATLILMFVLFPTPPSSSGEVLQGEHLGPESLRRVFGNSTLWIMGFALLGGYGSYFSAAQLLPHYAVDARHRCRDGGSDQRHPAGQWDSRCLHRRVVD
jgi:predicted MFS family arabinose efflux permease